ncbi:choice-of-anchor B family protein [Rubrivirga sp. IMCC45206]|uniref:choice-of-anchor B family protein n=1 Tax=Rubrivirga sp. IMCC45206 TaxID=3391614 RepID=UPI00398FC9EB
MRLFVLALMAALSSAASAQAPCAAGSAAGYPCDGIDLMAHLGLSAFASPGSGAPSAANDIWGWTHAASGREFALVGLTNGTAFVEVTTPSAPVFLGKLPTATSSSSWRDIKTIGDHAYIVSEAGSHGMQVFDLTQLLAVDGPPVTFAAGTTYTGFGSAHNVVVLEAADLAVGVGASTCAGGLEMVDVSTPLAPTPAGCFSADGYTHDAQCLIYSGPDADHTGRAICVASNEDTVTIVDVTDPSAPVQIARAFYPTPSYTHQGWFTDDQRYFIVNDELDGNSSTPTRTLVMDLLDLDDPEFAFAHDGTSSASDHNLYVVGPRVFQSNYTAGLQVLDAAAIGSGALSMVAYFDTEPATNAHGASTGTGGQWSNYPYFASGTVVASDIKNGLFVLAPRDGSSGTADLSPSALDLTVAPGETGRATLTLANTAGTGDLLYTASLGALSQPAADRVALPSPPPPFVGEPLVSGAVSGRPGAVDPGADAFGASKGSVEFAARLGDGGPDAFGYAWIDSDEPGGPAVAFQDISSTGTPIAFSGNDEGSATLTLPFAFPFYGASYTEVGVSTNGYAAFAYSQDYSNGPIPSAVTPNGLLAPFWDDLHRRSGTAYSGTLPDGRFVIQWTNWGTYVPSSGVDLTFQILLSDDGSIEYQYGTLTGPLDSATVGIEDEDGAVGLQVALNAAYLRSDLAIAFTQPTRWATLSGPASGVIGPGGSVGFDLDVDATDLPEGVYTTEITVSTSDAAAEITVVPVTLTVGGSTATSSVVIAGARGARFLGPPAAGMTVDDLAAQNLVRGVPGYFPDHPKPTLWTGYDTAAGRWLPDGGAGHELPLGRAVRWYLLDRDGVGDPAVSESRALPFTLATGRPVNDRFVRVPLDTGGNRFNHLANPFAEPLDVSGIRSWQGGGGLSRNTGVYTYDPATATWAEATTVAPWQAFRFRARGPRRNGNPRVLTIPSDARVPAAQAARAAGPTAPGLRFALEATSEAGRPLRDASLAVAFDAEATAAFDADEDTEKFQPPATAYALVGARVGRALATRDARPFAPAEVPLAVEARGTRGDATLRWDASALPAGLPVVLVDLATGEEVDVRARSSYGFRLAPSPALDDVPLDDLADPAAAADRFVLRIGAALASAGDVAAVALEAPVPNPSAGGARLEFGVPEAGAVRLSVFDARGREVAVLVDGPLAAGRHEAALPAGLAAGVYVVRLAAGGAVVSQRAAVVR